MPHRNTRNPNAVGKTAQPINEAVITTRQFLPYDYQAGQQAVVEFTQIAPRKK